MKILIAEDNRVLSSSIRRVLRQEGYTVVCIWDGEEAENYWIFNKDTVDLVILDLMLPKKNGISVCKTIRAEGINTPILMLTAKGELNDKVTGLNAGVDDYLVKPFEFDELIARINALLRRPSNIINEKMIISGNISVDLNAKKVAIKNKEINLTTKEFAILEYLIRNKNIAVSHQQIFDHVFDFAKHHSSNTIEVHMKNLRKKLFSNPKENVIKTVRGHGYRLEI